MCGDSPAAPSSGYGGRDDRARMDRRAGHHRRRDARRAGRHDHADVDRRDVFDAPAVHAPAAEHVGCGVRVRHPRHGERRRALRALLQGRPGGRAAEDAPKDQPVQDRRSRKRRSDSGSQASPASSWTSRTIPTSRSRSSPSPRRGSRSWRPCAGRWSGSVRATVSAEQEPQTEPLNVSQALGSPEV